jgi:hypothetical protein
MSGNRQIVSTATADGELILSITDNDMPTPNDDEVVVEMEAAPINPSDMFPLLGFADYSKGKLVTDGNEQKMVAPVSPQFVDADARASRPNPAGRAMRDRAALSLPVPMPNILRASLFLW